MKHKYYFVQMFKANDCNMWLISNAEYFVAYLTVLF